MTDFSWIKVKPYLEEDLNNPNVDWKQAYIALLKHHQDETAFLINARNEMLKKANVDPLYGYWSNVGTRAASTWGKAPGFVAGKAIDLCHGLHVRGLDSTVFVAVRKNKVDLGIRQYNYGLAPQFDEIRLLLLDIASSVV